MSEIIAHDVEALEASLVEGKGLRRGALDSDLAALISRLAKVQVSAPEIELAKTALEGARLCLRDPEVRRSNILRGVRAAIRHLGGSPLASPEAYRFALPMLPTPEQARVFAAAEEAGNLKVEALAGAAKSTTLFGIARVLGPGGLYLVFNAANKRDAEDRKPAGLTVLTGHGLAYRWKGAQYKAKKEIRSPSLNETVEFLELMGEDSFKAAWCVLRIAASYCISKDVRPDAKHATEEVLRSVCGGEETKPLEKLSVGERKTLDQLVEMADRMVKGMWAPGSKFPITHDAIFKEWALSKPKLDYRYILLDEAQDTNEVLLDVLIQSGVKLIVVGDQYQEIYSWRGAINALEKLDFPTVTLSQSFRFGPAIATAANAVLHTAGSKRKLIGASADPGVIGPIDRDRPFAVIARSNARICAEAAVLARSYKVAVVGGTKELVELLNSASALCFGQMNKVKHEKLRTFSSWRAFKEFAQQVDDAESAMLIKLLDDQDQLVSVRDIIDSLSNRMVDESAAQVILTTAHRSKGREFDQVVLLDDFKSPKKHRGAKAFDIREWYLLYVATTRARKVLEPNDLLKSLLPPGLFQANPRAPALAEDLLGPRGMEVAA